MTLFTWYRLLWDPWGINFARYLRGTVRSGTLGGSFLHAIYVVPFALGPGAGLLWALRSPVRNSLVFLLFLKGKSTILGQVAPGGPREAIPDYSGLFRTGLGWAALLAFDA